MKEKRKDLIKIIELWKNKMLKFYSESRCAKDENILLNTAHSITKEIEENCSVNCASTSVSKKISVNSCKHMNLKLTKVQFRKDILT